MEDSLKQTKFFSQKILTVRMLKKINNIKNRQKNKDKNEKEIIGYQLNPEST